jgi:hypothetical protein
MKLATFEKIVKALNKNKLKRKLKLSKKWKNWQILCLGKRGIKRQ